ncbi:hypothetical protein M3Y94_00818200 [Aphelenchoides besseyi]|nr:hypothetical protein M3Y94_00818200 [Aphelenchoides besseyi]
MDSEDKLIAYAYRAATICMFVNAALISLIYNYTKHPTPGLVCIQLFMPLLVWELLLVMAFCPNEILEDYLEAWMFKEGGLEDLHNMIQQRRRERRLRVVNGAGDIPPSERSFPFVTDDTETEMLSDRHFVLPNLRTD